MEKIIPDVNKQDLRKFGLTMAFTISVLFGLFLPWIFSKPITEHIWPSIISITLLVSALVLPIILKPVYKLWMTIGFVLGWINTRIILGIIFYLIFAPAGALMKLFREDPMCRTFNDDFDTYFKESLNNSKEHMERPY